MTEFDNFEALKLKYETLSKINLELRRQVDQLQNLILNEPGSAQKEYKDKLFKSIFGNPEYKQWTLSLYNAMNGSEYTNPDDISFNTLKDILYVRMKNDVSFMITSVMNIWEHQSSFNPNMPMRFLLYGSRLYDKYVFTHAYHKYSSKLQPVPTPKCVCFYNGTEDRPEKMELRLSQAYDGDGDIEVKVTMLNINYGKNKDLMDACKPLKEYSWLVHSVRSRQDELMDLNAAVDMAVDSMPDDYVLKAFLLEHRAEIKEMFLEDFNEESFRREIREEAYEDARKEIAVNLLKMNTMPISLIADASMLPEDTIKEIAAELELNTETRIQQ